jgi:hypothetical protein
MSLNLPLHIKEHAILGVEAGSGGGGSTTLSGLNDVSFSGLIANEIIQYNGITWTNVVLPSGVTDHGLLNGLLDDDHTQYFLLAGRASGQDIIGGIAASENLTLESTSHATKGEILLKDVTTGDGVNPLTLGVTAATSNALGADDVLVGGKLEVDGLAYLDTTSYIGGGGIFITNLYQYFPSTKVACFGGAYAGATFGGNTTQDQFSLTLDDAVGRQFVIGGSTIGRDYDHATPTDPTLFIHSVTDPNSDNTQWISFTHNQTNGLIQTGKGYLNLGTAAATGHALGVGDTLVGGKLEVDGNIYSDGTIFAYTNLQVLGNFYSDKSLIYKRRGTANYLVERTWQDDGYQIGIGNVNNESNHHLVFTSSANVGKDHNHDTLSTDPTIFLHSVTDPSSDDTQYIEFYHNQTDGVIGTGKGYLSLNDLKVKQVTDTTTINAAATTVATIALTDEMVYQIECRVIGRERDGSDRGCYHLEGLFYRTGAGNATQEGATTALNVIESEVACDVAFAVSGNNVLIQVTGVAVETWDWSGVYVVNDAGSLA